MNTHLAARHHRVTLSTVLDHVYVFGVTLVLSAATTFLIGAALMGRL